MANVDYVLPAIAAMADQYELIEDCIKGSSAIKAKGERYLPHPTPEDRSAASDARYATYKQRAVFYNVSKRTLVGLVGQIFMRDPVAKVPSLLDITVRDVDGGGVSLAQQSKQCANFVLSFGRAGLLVDYPDTKGRPASVADVQAGNIRPTFSLYHPNNIINWRTISKGARKLLSLVVLVETYLDDDDGFQEKRKKQWRVLRLDADELYVVEIYREDAPDTVHDSWMPTDANGNRLDEIPFTFVGATKNDCEIDEPPMFDLCDLNVHHYMDSADYQESSFICGQPTPVIAGLTEEWAKGVLKGVVALGSRSAIMLPVGASAELLQADPNTMPADAMEKKERQMVALGAKLVEQKTVQRTATEAGQDEASETSTLSAVAKNVAAAYKWGLEWAAIFVGVGDRTAFRDGKGAIEYDLNTEFDLAQMTPDELKAVLALWQGEAITEEEMRDNLTRAGFATFAIEDYRSKIQTERTASLDRMAQETAATTPPVDPVGAKAE